MSTPTGDFRRGRQLAQAEAAEQKARDTAAGILDQMLADLAPLGVVDPADPPRTIGGLTAAIEAEVSDLRRRAARGDEIAAARDAAVHELSQWLMSPVGV
jgi:multidrug resistance efflux pump